MAKSGPGGKALSWSGGRCEVCILQNRKQCSELRGKVVIRPWVVTDLTFSEDPSAFHLKAINTQMGHCLMLDELLRS